MPEITKKDLEEFIKKDELQELVENVLVDILNVKGLIETVVVAPTHIPTKFEQQVKIQVDDIDSPTTRKLYIYNNKSNEWKSTALT